MDEIFEKNLISTKNAGELSGYSSDYLARLARSGKIDGKRIGHSWFIDKDSLASFLDQQGNRKIDYARALARARETEYRERHSLLHNTANTLSKPIKVPFKNIIENSVRSQAVALSVAFIVVAFGAFVTRADVVPELANRVITIANETAFGFTTTFGTIPSNIAAEIDATSVRMNSVSPKLHNASALAFSHFSLPRVSLAENHNAFYTHYPAIALAPTTSANTPILTIADIQSSALALRSFSEAGYAFFTTPSHIASALANAYAAVGSHSYAAIVASFIDYQSLIQQSGIKTLALAASARDALVTAPHFVSQINLAIGSAIIEGTHAAIRGDMSASYGISVAAPATGHAALALIMGTGNILAGSTAQTPALALRSFNDVALVLSSSGPALAQAFFGAEYSGASRFVAFTNAVSEHYLALISNTGRFAYVDTLALRDFGNAEISFAHSIRTFIANGPATIEDAYLGTLGKSALALNNFVEGVPALRKLSEVGLAAVVPTLSTGEQVAVITYQTINNLFSSTTDALAYLFEPPTIAVLPTLNFQHAATTTTAHITTTQTTNNSYPTYTTVVNGVSQDSMNQSLAALRNNILSTVAGMIQPVAAQGAVNETTIQQVNMIQDLSDLTVRNGTFLGGSLTGANSVSAYGGSFDNLSAGTFSAGSTTLTDLAAGSAALATTTITGDLTVSGIITPSIISANSFISAPYFIATSSSAISTFAGSLNVGGSSSLGNQAIAGFFTATTSTATSTFAGSLAIGTSSPWGNGLLTVGTSSPLLYIDSNTGNIGIGTTSPQYPLDLSYTSTGTSGSNKGINISAINNPSSASSQNSYAIFTTNDYQSNFSTNSGVFIMGGYLSARNDNAAYLENLVGMWGKAENLSSGSIDDSTGVVGQSRNSGSGTMTNSYGVNGATRNNSTGTITNAIGVYGDIINANAGGTITNAYNIKASTPFSNAGTIDNLYGVYISSQNPTGGGTILNKWALYQAGASDQSYFAGNVGIGTASPAYKLDVAGTGGFLTSVAIGGTSTTTIAGDGNASTIYGPLTVRGISTQPSSLTLQRGNNNGNNTISFNDQVGTALMQIYTGSNTAATGYIVGDQTYLSLGTSVGGAAFTIDSNSVSQSVSTKANLIPTATNTYDLGSSTNYWNNGYITTAHIGGNLNVAGNSIVLGNSLTDSLTINSAIKSSIVPNQNITYDLGSPSYYWNNAYVGTLVANNISAASTTIGGTSSKTFTLDSANATADADTQSLIFFRGTVVPNAVLSWNAVAAAKRFELNQPLYIQNGSASTTETTFVLKGVAGQTGLLTDWQDSNGNSVASMSAVGVLTASSANFTTFPTTPLAKGNFLVGSDSGIAQATSSIFISSLGNVGIGTTTPDSLSALTVYGLGKISTGNANDPLSIHSNGGDTTASGLSIYNPSNNTGSFFSMDFAGASFSDGGRFKGIDNEANGVYLYTNAAPTNAAAYIALGTSGTTPVYFATHSTVRETIDPNGLIGIGTTSPYSLLSISNSASTAVNTPLFTIASTTSGNSTTTLMTVLANGNVGIGTASPGNELDIMGLNGPAATSGTGANGGVRIETAAMAAVLDIGGDTTGAVTNSWLQARNSGNYATNYNIVLQPNGGNVGIGTTNPLVKLSVGWYGWSE